MIRNWILAALGGLGVSLGAARLAAGVLANGESYEGVLPVLAVVLLFLGGLAAGGLGLLLSKGGFLDVFAPTALLFSGLLLSGFVMGGELCSFSQLLLRGGAMLLGGVLIFWSVRMAHRGRGRGKSGGRSSRSIRKKS